MSEPTEAPTEAGNPTPVPARMNRRDWLKSGARGAGWLGLLGGGIGLVAARAKPAHEADTVWQLDPDRCIQCGRCATACVLTVSAVKCLHAFSMCGYCKLCTGYFEPEPVALDEGAENQLCPTGALQRKFIEDPYYEYHIIEELCVGCGKCVKGCTMFGNGSLYLQVSHDRCLHCNECAIAVACPSQAFVRRPTSHAYFSRAQAATRP